MSKVDWQRVENVYAQVIEQDPVQRAAFLDRLCAADAPELRVRVEALLRSHQSAESDKDHFLQGVFGRLANSILEEHSLQPETKLQRRYVIDSVMAIGGMGIVYHGRDTNFTPPRPIAIKMISADLSMAAAFDPGARGEVLQRFRDEANVLARLKGQHFVQIHDVGEWEGQLFIVMELVEGASLADRSAKTFAPPDAARLVATLADAISQPHMLKIVHRDLKPANILMSPDGVPKIADFGIAKFTGEIRGIASSGVDTAQLPRHQGTLVGRVLGTHDYMSPEQWSGDPSQVGTAADIYALGAILYELLSGFPPFTTEARQESPVSPPGAPEHDQPPPHHGYTRQLHRLVTDPVRPPTRLERVPKDLEAICLKCVAKAPDQRYATATALKEDLEHFLAGEPVDARPIRSLERAWKWCRRSPYQTAALVLLAATLAASAVAAVTEKRRADQQEANAKEEKRLRDEAVARLVRLHTTDGDRELRSGYFHQSLPYYSQVLQLDPDRANLHRIRLGSIQRLSPTPTVVCAHQDAILFACLSPDERWLLTTDRSGLARIWSASDGTLMRQLRHGGPVRHGSFSSDGESVVTASDDSTVRLWDWRRDSDTVLQLKNPGRFAWFGSPGADIVTVEGDASPEIAKRWEHREKYSTGHVLMSVESVLGNRAIFSGDGKYVALVTWGLATRDGFVKILLFNLSTLKLTTIEARKLIAVSDVRFTPDGQWLIAAAHGRIHAWRSDSGQPGRMIAGNDGKAAIIADDAATPFISTKDDLGHVRLVAVSASGTTLSAVGDNSRLQFCTSPVGRVLTYRVDGNVTAIRYGGDGKTLITISGEANRRTPNDPFTSHETRSDSRTRHEAQVWDPESGQPLTPPLLHRGPISTAFLTRDGSRAVTAGEDGAAVIWNLRHSAASYLVAKVAPADERDRALDTICRTDSVLLPVQRRPDGQDEKGSFHVFKLEFKEAAPTRQLVWSDARLTTQEVTADGKWVWLNGEKLAELFDLSTGAKRASLLHEAAFSCAGVDRKARRAVTFTEDVVYIWDLNGGQRLTWSPGGKLEKAWLSPDGRRVLVADGDGKLRAHDIDRKSDSPVLADRAGNSVGAFSPDGNHFLLTDRTEAVLINLDSETRQVLSHSSVINATMFSPDGSVIASACSDGTVRLWDGRTGQSRGRWLEHRSSVTALEFSEDGQWLVTVSAERLVQVWQVATGDALTPPIRQPEKVHAVAYRGLGHDLYVVQKHPDSDEGVQIIAWSLVPDQSTNEEIARRVSLLAGFEIEKNQGLRQLDGPMRREAWERLQNGNDR